MKAFPFYLRTIQKILLAEWRLLYFDMSYHIMPCHTMTCHISFYVMSCHMSCYATPYHIACHVASYHIHCSHTTCLQSCPFNSLHIGRPSEVVVTLQAHVFVVILRQIKVGLGACIKHNLRINTEP